MPLPATSAAAACHGDYLYVIGGSFHNGSAVLLDTVFRYNVFTGDPSIQMPPMNGKRAGASALVLPNDEGLNTMYHGVQVPLKLHMELLCFRRAQYSGVRWAQQHSVHHGNAVLLL